MPGQALTASAPAAHFASGAGSRAAVFPSLTGREREVLETITAGKGNAGTAQVLMISPKTVRNRVSNIFPSSRCPTAPP